jgi:hypothetical protein
MPDNAQTVEGILKDYIHEHYNDQGADSEKLLHEAQRQLYNLVLEAIGFVPGNIGSYHNEPLGRFLERARIADEMKHLFKQDKGE